MQTEWVLRVTEARRASGHSRGKRLNRAQLSLAQAAAPGPEASATKHRHYRWGIVPLHSPNPDCCSS